MRHAPEFLRLETPAAREELRLLAEREGHDARAMTHALLDASGRVIGAAALPSAVVRLWIREPGATRMGTLGIAQAAHAAMSFAGAREYALLCPRSSPLYPYAARIGLIEAPGDMALLWSCQQFKGLEQ